VIHWELRELSGSNQSPRLDLTPYPKKSKKTSKTIFTAKRLGVSGHFLAYFCLFAKSSAHTQGRRCRPGPWCARADVRLCCSARRVLSGGFCFRSLKITASPTFTAIRIYYFWPFLAVFRLFFDCFGSFSRHWCRYESAFLCMMNSLGPGPLRRFLRRFLSRLRRFFLNV
jgi:hypothetical protein